MDNPILFKMKGIEKKYPGTIALSDIDMDVHKGEIVGLIGENGAGKSTLLKIIAGVELSTSGTIEMNGAPLNIANPIQANRLGIGMVFQEQSLIKNLTVSQNIFLGREKRFKKCGLINWKAINKSAKDALGNIGIVNIPPEKKVVDLNFATRQLVEIAKVFNIVSENSDNGCLILLDEPTSVLNDNEIEKLFEEMQKMKAKGNSIIFVSHRLDEVLRISDRIYIFKDGRNVGIVAANEADESVLYEKMVGRATTGEYFKSNRQTKVKDDVVLEVSDLGVRGHFKGVSFKLSRSEVLGICGVVGSGKEELCSVICGDDDYTDGSIRLFNRKRRYSSPSEALRLGILSVPKERRDEGVIGILSVLDNINFSNYKVVSKNGFVSRQMQVSHAKEWISKLSIKCSSLDENIEYLSGGNAQKVVFARAFSSYAKVLILNHPTRGVDVGAKEEIYNLIRDITDSGIAVILLGDTLDECIGLSSRILVMKDGIVSREFGCPANAKPDQVEIIKYMM